MSRVGEIEARLAAATPGPWQCDDRRPRYILTAAPIEIDEADYGQPEGSDAALMALALVVDRNAWRYADVRLVAAAPEDLRWCLDRIAEAQTVIRDVYEVASPTENDAEIAGWRTRRSGTENAWGVVKATGTMTVETWLDIGFEAQPLYAHPPLSRVVSEVQVEAAARAACDAWAGNQTNELWSPLWLIVARAALGAALTDQDTTS